MRGARLRLWDLAQHLCCPAVWLAATTPVPSPKCRRRVSARRFGHSSIEVARSARFPTLIRHEVRLPHLCRFSDLPILAANVGYEG